MKLEYSTIRKRILKFKFQITRGVSKVIYTEYLKSLFAYIDNTSQIYEVDGCSCPQKIYIGAHCVINRGAQFIISPKRDGGGKFIMKDNTVCSSNLTVITGNHGRKIGHLFIDTHNSREYDIDEDVIIEEDVWIGTNVTILKGVTVGRGATVAAGSIVTKSVPPYSICAGVPAKVQKFYWSIDEILVHENALYPPEKRLTRQHLESEIAKYF